MTEIKLLSFIFYENDSLFNENSGDSLSFYFIVKLENFHLLQLMGSPKSSMILCCHLVRLFLRLCYVFETLEGLGIGEVGAD